MYEWQIWKFCSNFLIKFYRPTRSKMFIIFCDRNIKVQKTYGLSSDDEAILGLHWISIKRCDNVEFVTCSIVLLLQLSETSLFKSKLDLDESSLTKIKVARKSIAKIENRFVYVFIFQMTELLGLMNRVSKKPAIKDSRKAPKERFSSGSL